VVELVCLCSALDAIYTTDWGSFVRGVGEWGLHSWVGVDCGQPFGMSGNVTSPACSVTSTHVLSLMQVLYALSWQSRLWSQECPGATLPAFGCSLEFTVLPIGCHIVSVPFLQSNEGCDTLKHPPHMLLTRRVGSTGRLWLFYAAGPQSPGMLCQVGHWKRRVVCRQAPAARCAVLLAAPLVSLERTQLRAHHAAKCQACLYAVSLLV